MVSMLTTLAAGLWLAVAAPAPQTADEAAILAFGDRWRAAYEAGDLDALADLYEPDATLYTRHRPAKRGRDEILAYFEAAKASGAEASIRFAPEAVEVDGSYGFLTALWWLTVTPPGGEPIMDAGRSFLVLKKGEDGAWRVWRDMDNHTPDATPDDKEMP
jgi:uncharacterized protein (TIGR02246 family)